MPLKYQKPSSKFDEHVRADQCILVRTITFRELYVASGFRPLHAPWNIFCLCAKEFPHNLTNNITCLVALGTIFNVSSMVRCGPDSNPTLPLLQAYTLPITLMVRV